MIDIKCIECGHCLDKVESWFGSYYPRNCGEGMTFNADCFCSKSLPYFKDKSKRFKVDRSSRSIIVESNQLSLF